MRDFCLLFFVLPLVTSYVPCSDVFQRISAPGPSQLHAKIQVSVNHAEVGGNHLVWRFQIKFNSRIQIKQVQPIQLERRRDRDRRARRARRRRQPLINLNVSIGLHYRKWVEALELDYLNISHEVDTDKAIFKISLSEDDFDGPWWSLNFNFFIHLAYESHFIDVTRIEVNNRSICTDANICGEFEEPSVLLIKGGKPDNRTGVWPWLAAIHQRKLTEIKFVCAGTLVSTKHVITAGHCIRDEESATYPVLDIVVVLGSLTNFDTSSKDVQSYKVSDFIVHRDWGARRNGKRDADIAILILEQSVMFTKFVKPACLDLNEMVGTIGAVAGWGTTERYAPSLNLRQIKMPIVGNKACVQSNPGFYSLTSERTFCAGDRNGTGPCTGDSGGGFYTNVTLPGDRPRYSLTGIVSRSLSSETEDCDLSKYVIFTRISTFLPWIDFIARSKSDTAENHRLIFQDVLQEVSKLRKEVQNEKENCKKSEIAELKDLLRAKTDDYENIKNKLEGEIESIKKQIATQNNDKIHIKQNACREVGDNCAAVHNLNGKNYLFGEKLYDWFESEKICSSVGMKMFSPESLDEYQNILAFISSYYGNSTDYWIGANDFKREGTFLWTNGRPLEFSFWRPHEPSNSSGNEDCVVMVIREGLWNDDDCEKKTYKFICS